MWSMHPGTATAAICEGRVPHLRFGMTYASERRQSTNRFGRRSEARDLSKLPCVSQGPGCIFFEH